MLHRSIACDCFCTRSCAWLVLAVSVHHFARSTQVLAVRLPKHNRGIQYSLAPHDAVTGEGHIRVVCHDADGRTSMAIVDQQGHALNDWPHAGLPQLMSHSRVVLGLSLLLPVLTSCNNVAFMKGCRILIFNVPSQSLHLNGLDSNTFLHVDFFENMKGSSVNIPNRPDYHQLTLTKEWPCAGGSA